MIETNTTSSLNQSEKILLYPSFSAIFFPRLFVYLYLDSFYSYFFAFFIPGFTFDLRIISFILIQVIGFPFLYGLMSSPFQKIDFSRNALRQSFFHKLTFVATSPLLLFGLVLAVYVQHLNNDFFNFFLITFIYYEFWLIIIISIWGLTTQFIWDVMTNLLTIQTSKEKRKLNLRFYSSSGVDRDSIRFIEYIESMKSGIDVASSNRWMVLSIELPILIIWLLFINPQFGRMLILLGFYTFGFLILLPLYRPIFKKYKPNVRYLTKLNIKLFGYYDISDSTRNDSIACIFACAFLISILFATMRTQIYFSIIYFILYVLMILIFMVSIWGNQIFKIKEPLLDVETKAIVNQLQRMIRGANKEDSILYFTNFNKYAFKNYYLIRKILPHPFDTHNWIIFTFKNPLFNPFIVQELASLVDIQIYIEEVFDHELLKVFSNLNLKPWEQYVPEREIYNKIIQLYSFKVSIFQEKSQNKIFFFNFKNTFLLIDQAIHPLIADNFMEYWDGYLKHIIYTSQLVEKQVPIHHSLKDVNMSSELIFWNLTDDFVSTYMARNKDFLKEQYKARKENIFND